MFTFYEIIVIVLSCVLILKCKPSYKYGNGTSKFLFIGTVIAIFITLFNPNNSFNLIELLFSEEIRKFYILVLFLYAVLFLKQEIRSKIVYAFWKIGIWTVLIGTLYYLLRYLSGNGMVWLGREVTLTYSDTLRLLSLVQIVFLTIYLQTSKTRHLLISLILLFALFFSFRRANLYLALIVDGIMIFAYFIVNTEKRRLIFISLSVIVVVVLASTLVPRYLLEDVILRNVGIFSNYAGMRNADFAYSDSGHLAESIITTKYFLANFLYHFWGGGIGGRRIYTGEFSSKIHNSFVHVWSLYGLHLTIYYLVILVVLLRRSWNNFGLILSEKGKQDFIVFSMSIYLTVYFLSGWLTGAAFTDYLQSMVVFVMLFSVTNIG